MSKGSMAVHYSSQTPEWATPQWLFDRLNAEFAFTLDVCATAENAKCPKFFTKEDDGLKQEWSGVCWMNPPYGREIGKWVQKAFQSASDGATVVCLIPARTDTRWFHKYCKHGIRQRGVRSVDRDGGMNRSAIQSQSQKGRKLSSAPAEKT